MEMRGADSCLLLKNAELYAPEAMGVTDILIANGAVLAVGGGEDSCTPDGFGRREVREAARALCAGECELDGAAVIPGLFDQHVHVTGGGGENGFSSRIRELTAEELLSCGVTSVVGTLGTDSLTRSVHSLVAKTRALREQGLSAWCLTGAYTVDSPTLTGTVEGDICFIDEIIGCKVAVNDHRCSYPTWQELARLASKVRFAALTGGKAGELHIHVGRGREGLSLLFEVLDRTELPIRHLRPTHCENVFDDALSFAARGGYIDFTADEDPRRTADLIVGARDRGVDPGLITVSSDAGGSIPVWNERGEMTGMEVGTPSTLLPVIRALVEEKGMPLPEALRHFTTAPAEALLPGGARKGRIAPGMAADLVVLGEDWSVAMGISGGALQSFC